jgi:hypothetical protein
MTMKLAAFPAIFFAAALSVASCSNENVPANPAPTGSDDLAAISIDQQVEEYLFLELSMGLHDAAQVDAYFGPEHLQTQAESEQLSLDEIAQRTAALAQSVSALPRDGNDGLERQRIESLESRLLALQTRIQLNQGMEFSFDDESRLLFDATAPSFDASHFERILEKIDALLPGDGPLPERVTAFRERFIIPPDRLSAVFEAALEECRRRTLQHIDLPAHESFTIEYVTDKPWSGYNWYQGGANSLIQVNTDLPSYIDAAVDLGCHEGYPGHHTYNALLEQHLVLGKGWKEFSLYPLFSPQSLVAEGSANYGISLAFPGDERIEFEREYLFPLAGLDASDADRYYRLAELRSQLDYAINESARQYLNGTFSSEQAQEWLVNYALDTPEKAEQRISFFDSYRSYVINYNFGKDLVEDWVTAGDADSDQRWQRFIQLLSSPMSPSDLVFYQHDNY